MSVNYSQFEMLHLCVFEMKVNVIYFYNHSDYLKLKKKKKKINQISHCCQLRLQLQLH